MGFPDTAMILAAGFGTRLRPLTHERPKALLSVGGRPMIEYPLRMLAAAGIGHVVVNVHHLGEQIPAALGDGSRFGVRLDYSREDPILDTGGALAHARPLLGNGPFFLVNCDALLDVDLRALWETHERHGALATLVVRRHPAAARYGAIDLDAEGRIRRFLERPETVAEPLERRMFCGLHVISPTIFDWMPAGGVFSITRDIYARAHAGGAVLHGFRYDAFWYDLGTPAALDEVEQALGSGTVRISYLSTPPD
jgi:NDP-sugar pyrophosphorylase family protein